MFIASISWYCVIYCEALLICHCLIKRVYLLRYSLSTSACSWFTFFSLFSSMSPWRQGREQRMLPTAPPGQTEERNKKMSIINSFESGFRGPEYVPKVLDLVHTETYCRQRLRADLSTSVILTRYILQTHCWYDKQLNYVDFSFSNLWQFDSYLILFYIPVLGNYYLWLVIFLHLSQLLLFPLPIRMYDVIKRNLKTKIKNLH